MAWMIRETMMKAPRWYPDVSWPDVSSFVLPRSSIFTWGLKWRFEVQSSLGAPSIQQNWGDEAWLYSMRTSDGLFCNCKAHLKVKRIPIKIKKNNNNKTPCTQQSACRGRAVCFVTRPNLKALNFTSNKMYSIRAFYINHGFWWTFCFSLQKLLGLSNSRKRAYPPRW